MEKFFTPATIDRLVGHIITVSGALLLLFLGWHLIGWLMVLFRRFLQEREVDTTLVSPAVSFVSVSLKIALFLAVISTMGVQTTSFLAVLSAAGLAIGLALQGSLSNLAGGVLLLVLRPIRVGEFVDTMGSMGVVREIGLFMTTLEDSNRANVFLPNGDLAKSKIVNLSRSGLFRLNVSISVAHGTDIEQVRQIVLPIMQQHSAVLPEPPPQLVLKAITDNSLNLVLRPWCEATVAPSLETQLLESVKKALEQHGIALPPPSTT